MGQAEVVALPGLETYSADQLQQARELSPALSRYLNLLANPMIESLRARRHRAWCECALATFFATAETAVVCAYWSATADLLLREAWAVAGLDPLPAVLFALGKHGAEELNLSSDIDLLVVADPERGLEIERGLRRFQQLLQSANEFGFCFRLDFDLRPGGKLGPILTSPSQFQDYYWSQGETWERLALVRLRAIAGAKSLEQQIADLARRFSYRKFLDFTLLDDLKAMRTQVHQKGFQRREEELHIKLEVGGIRDIELFVHSLLVLNGGKRPDLQTRATDVALDRLGAAGILPADEARLLRESYWFFRNLENSVQAVEDRQTHTLTDNNLRALSLPDRAEVSRRMAEVDRVVSGLLGKIDLNEIHLPNGEAAQIEWLLSLGFNVDVVRESWDQLIRATALSHKNDRDERARREFLYAFVTALAKHRALDRDLGLGILVDFVRALRAKATFFSMLLRSPSLIEDLSRLFCLSPYLGSILASRPELMDHFILRVDEQWSADMEKMLQQMSERKLLTELWSANQFLQDRRLDGLFTRVTATADEICAQLLSQLKHEYPDSLVKILALGKWGGQELGLRSDLDFIFVTPGAPRESDFKVARRFISRLTDPHRGGSLYDVDLRLRPSGQSGLLLISEENLSEYWRERAQAWERQAYLRARPFGVNLDKTILVERGLSSTELDELGVIRRKLLVPAAPDELDIKYVPGGLLDIEFVAQTALLANKINGAPTATLDMIEVLRAQVPIWQSDARLKDIYSELRTFEQMLQLSSAYKVGAARREQADFAKACALLGLAADEGWRRLNDLTRESRTLLNDLDPTGLQF